MPSSFAPDPIEQMVTEYLRDYTTDTPSPRGGPVTVVRKRKWMPRRRLSPQRRRARLLCAALVLALLGLSVGVWASPPVPTWGPGPSPEQVALQREIARAQDLKRRLDVINAQLEQPDPNTYEAEKARADDLQHQLDVAEAKLMIPKAPIGDAGQRARAEDLQRRLKVLNALIEQPRPPVTDAVAAARAADLAAQNDALEAIITRPRPPVDPLAGVTASLTKAQILQGRQLFGLYTAQAPFNYAEVNLIQQELSRKANIVGYFQSWKNDFRADAVKQTWLRGQIPLLTWESQLQVGSITADVPEYSLPKIIGGTYDDYIHRYAHDIAATGLPLILRLDHEMNGTWYPWSETKGTTGESINGNSPGDFSRMWRHVHDIFEAEGANNYVIWLWSPNRVNAIPSQPDPKAFYPGDSFVDWIGMSGYFRPYDNGPYFTETHGKTLPLLRAAGNKPILLAEIGATELGGQKAQWVNSLFANLKKNPDVIGFVWFSLTVTNKHEGQTQTNDWRIDSSSSATDAVKAGLADGGWGLPAS